MATYIGFSSVDSDVSSVKLTDVHLVNRDLMNHFSTFPGEVRGRPNHGSTLPLLISRPDDEITESEIYAEVLRVVSYDPRARVQSFAMTRISNGVEFRIKLRYVELNISGFLEFALYEQT